MPTLVQDLRYGFRMLIKSPGFTAVAVLTLALGIGANTAIFSVVNGVLLRPLPFREPEKLLSVQQTQPARGNIEVGFTQAGFIDYRDQQQVFETIAAYSDWNFNLTGGDQAERLTGAQVSADFFRVLGRPAKLGRVLRPGEDVAGNNHVIVISHGLWQRRFNSDPNVIGQTVAIDGRTMVIIGVMPDDFRFPGRRTELWVPMDMKPSDPERTESFYQAVARLKPGLTLAQAQAHMDRLARALEEKNPDDYRGRAIRLLPLTQQVIGDTGTPLLILLGAVGFVLLIACANVANLQLARASAREKEVAVRLALGANRGRLVRQLLTESLLLAFIGGGLGLLLALWGVDVLLAISPDGIPRLDEVAVNGPVLGSMLGLTLLTGVLFGLAPALQASRPDLSSTLKQGTGAGGGARHRLRKLLVVSEVALALVLLIGAGLLVRSFLGLRAVNPGFDPEKVLTLPIWLSPLRYEDGRQQARYAEQALERIRAVPGVEAAAAAAFLPFGGANVNATIAPEGAQTVEPGQLPVAAVNLISRDYFRSMGIPLLAGRDFDERDQAHSLRVAIVNQALAKRVWPNGDAVGQRVQFGGTTANAPWFSIIGVVGDVYDTSLRAAPGPQFYLLHAQSPFAVPLISFVVRAAGDPARLIAAVRHQLLAIDKDQPVFDIKTMSARLAESVATQRFQLIVLGVFAVMALVLAAVGIYGVMSSSVAERRREIGIRLALGAQPASVLRLVLGQGLMLALAGVGLGLGAAVALTRFMESLLFEVRATDPATFAVIASLLTFVALLACYVPARRATRVDPMVALRYE